MTGSDAAVDALGIADSDKRAAVFGTELRCIVQLGLQILNRMDACARAVFSDIARLCKGVAANAREGF